MALRLNRSNLVLNLHTRGKQSFNNMIFKHLNICNVNNLIIYFEENEIKNAMWDYDSYMSHMTCGFLKYFWNVVKNDFVFKFFCKNFM